MRNLKSKDQHIQESAVKIELMERRMEGVKKQADAIADLETELVKAKKQHQSYDDAIEQLQADLDTLEQENAKLKANAPSQEKQASGTPAVELDSIVIEGNLETSYLLEQVGDRIFNACSFIETLVPDRRVPWCCSFPPHGELVPQGPGPSQGDSGIAPPSSSDD